MLTERLGFRVDVIFPADDPANAVVSGHPLRIRLEAIDHSAPAMLRLVTDEPLETLTLPGGTRIEYSPATTSYHLPENRPSVVVTRRTDESGVGRAGMRYRDLIPARWGGRFIASHITIPDGGPVPDHVYFHKIRDQMIFVKSGWVHLVYEDQGEPFTMHAGDCVLQPPEIRHRVLESSAGLEVVEVENGPTERLGDADSVAIPGGTRYRLVDPSDDCELLDVTLPAVFDVHRD